MRDDTDFHGQSVLVTGGASGIGWAAARAFVQRNYDLDTVCLPRQIALIERVASGKFPRFTSTAIADGFPGAPPEANPGSTPGAA